uniref:Uncharacterized protein n=1 Tax=Lygus hesperus TaxID=30085 RepID=A0A146L631_LYGHE
MFRGGNLNNSKYQKCKCLVPCVAKYLNMMYTDGTYDFREIRKVTSGVQSDYFRKEIERVLDICETEPGKECDGGFNIVNCAIQHSHIASRSLRLMFEALDEHYAQSHITDAPSDGEANDD